MSADSAETVSSVDLQAVRVIHCIIPDDGTDRVLIEALRSQKNIEIADSVACRAISALGSVVKTRRFFGKERLPEPLFAKWVQIVAPEEDALQVMDFVCSTANIGRPDGGMVFMGKPLVASPFHLPELVQDDADHVSAEEND